MPEAYRTGRQDVHEQRHTEPAGERLEILGREEVPMTVTMETKEQILAVSVKDNGNAVAPQHQKKFTQFYQVPATRRSSKRYGIGLAQAKYNIEEHQGDKGKQQRGK